MKAILFHHHFSVFSYTIYTTNLQIVIRYAKNDTYSTTQRYRASKHHLKCMCHGNALLGNGEPPSVSRAVRRFRGFFLNRRLSKWSPKVQACHKTLQTRPTQPFILSG